MNEKSEVKKILLESFKSQDRLKIKACHLRRMAILFIREAATVDLAIGRPVEETQARELRRVAHVLRWSSKKIKCIKVSSGVASNSAECQGAFKFMLAQIAKRRVGAVICSEITRITRNHQDFQRLINVCALNHTLVIVGNEIYDPRNEDDQLPLGFPNSLHCVSILEWERKRLLARLRAGQICKARKGHLRVRPPAGFICDRAGKLILDPDLQIQTYVRIIFDLFEQLGSASAIAKYYQENHLLFPFRLCRASSAGEVFPRLLRRSFVIRLLKNPAYAGAYVYGRTKSFRQDSPDGMMRGSGVLQVKREDWPVVIHDAHPGYITWERYLKIQQRLNANRRCSKKAEPELLSFL